MWEDGTQEQAPFCSGTLSLVLVPVPTKCVHPGLPRALPGHTTLKSLVWTSVVLMTDGVA